MTSTLDDARGELLACPLCHSDDVHLGVCYAGDSNEKEPAVRCGKCSCRATLKAWNTRAPARCDAETRDVLWGISERVSNVIRSYMTKQTDGRLMGLLNDVAHDVHEEIMTPLMGCSVSSADRGSPDAS